MAGILLAGFGGQGILFAGKQLTKSGMEAGKYVSWLPSYGPEMRGGTCNCSVNIDDKPIGSPLVTVPDILIAMNLPSFEKFIGKVRPGGCAFIDSKVIKETGIFDFDFFRSELLSSAPKSKPQLGELNAQALKIGYEG